MPSFCRAHVTEEHTGHCYQWSLSFNLLPTSVCFPETLFPLLLVPNCVMLPTPLWYPWWLGMLLILVQDLSSTLQTNLLLLILSELNILSPWKLGHGWEDGWKRVEVICVTGVCSRLCSSWAAAQPERLRCKDTCWSAAAVRGHQDLLSSVLSWSQYRRSLEAYWGLCSLVLFFCWSAQ